MKIIIRLISPLSLFLTILAYMLGAGMAHYLGLLNDSLSLYLGLAWVLLVQSAAYLLAEYHRPAAQPYRDDETPRQRIDFRTLLLQVSAALLVLAGGVTVLMAAIGYVRASAALYLALIFLSMMGYAVPPFMLFRRGYGELVLAFHTSAFVPGLAYVLQAGEFHRILIAFTFPLTMLGMAFWLALNFQSFASDHKYGRNTFLIRLTWQRAVPLHHVSILVGYILFAAAPLMGFPWAVVWPIFLTVPLGLFQIYWLNRIAIGGKPVWPFFYALSAAVFGFAVYTLAVTFWIR